MKVALLIFLLCLSGITLSDEGIWRPDPKFQLENSNYMQTLHWISGVSYTLSKLQTDNMFLCGGVILIVIE